MAGAREPSMEDILASIKRVIAEEKEIRAAAPPPIAESQDEEEDVLELDESMEALTVPPVDLGPPLLEDEAADESRQKLETLASVAASRAAAAASQSARGDGPRDAPPDPQAMARRASAGHRRRACEARNPPHHRAGPL